MHWRAIWITIALFSCVAAYAKDEQLALYAVTSPRFPEYSGLGLEIATNPIPRLSLASTLEMTNPFNTSVARIGAQGRLRFSADLNTHWYPIVGISWSSDQSTWHEQFGAGFERRIRAGTGFYSELLWSAEPANQQIRLGLRFWLLRLDSLDLRMQRAEPKGAIYQGGPMGQVAIETTNMTPVPTQPEPLTLPAQNNAPDVKAQTPVPVVPATASQPSLTEGWYVQLGVFRQRESVARLEQDRRLSDLLEQRIVWFDDDLKAHRFLLGPFSKVRAAELQSQLKNAGLDSILYDGVR